MRRLWNKLNRRDKFGFISFLQKGETWDPDEFHRVGIRFVERMAQRFTQYGNLELPWASVLEIGCGVGRFLKPLACRFKKVYGIDISARMLKTAGKYCAGLPNITLRMNDGSNLPFDDNTMDYCVSAGVFQHITHLEVITGYIKEALRVLKPGGLFLFQFDGTRATRVGREWVGARITAQDLDKVLAGQPFCIREVSIDPNDPVRNVVIVIQKTDPLQPSGDTAREFRTFKMTERRWLSGVYDDIATRTTMHKRLQKESLPLTFYNTDIDIVEQLTVERVDNVAIWGTGLSGQLLVERLKNTPIRVTAVYDSFKKGKFMEFTVKKPLEVEMPVDVPVIIASSRSLEELSPMVQLLKSRGIPCYFYR